MVGVLFLVALLAAVALSYQDEINKAISTREDEDEDIGGGLNLQRFGDELMLDPMDVVAVSIVDGPPCEVVFDGDGKVANILFADGCYILASHKAGKELMDWLGESKFPEEQPVAKVA